MLHDEEEGKILHLEIVTNVSRYFLLRHIVSRYVIECILNLEITFIGMDRNALEAKIQQQNVRAVPIPHFISDTDI